MENDDRMVCNRFMEAANNCYYRNVPTSTDFLDIYKQNLFNTVIRELPPVQYRFEGGYELAERKVIMFLPQDSEISDLPFLTLKVTPRNLHFTEKLNHRDYLGSIMGLGIKRDKVGDILLYDNCTYIFCMKSIAEYLTDNLLKIRNTYVTVTEISNEEFIYEPSYEVIKGSVASLRLDAVIALGFNGSRSHITSYIIDGKVSVNGRIITSNAYNLKAGDIISVRGLGKIRYMDTLSETKKGRIMITINKYT